jgi:acetyltransferase-like isoleucine patch superfamily enzyme
MIRLHGVTLSRAVTLEASSEAVLDIGKSWLGPGAIVSARDRITIGDGTALAEYVTIRDHNHIHDPEHPVLAWEYDTDPVVIKNDVWIASKATIVAGVTIEDHALCAAGAVITRDVQVWQRVGGVPARPLGSSPKVFTSADNQLNGAASS